MTKPSPRMFAGLLAALALLMIVTRLHHFGTALHLPDASMAVFFLGGLYLRRYLVFVGLCTLAVLLDWYSVAHAGVSDFCITPAYSFLLPAYAVLWLGGRWFAGRLPSSRAAAAAGLMATALASASLSFLISNGAFYWLGGRYLDPYFSEYVARVWQWGPLFVRTTMVYVGIAALLHLLLVRLRGPRAAHA